MSEDDANPILRVFHGGSWYYEPALARVAYRYWYSPGYRDDGLGVRLVRIATPVQQLTEVECIGGSDE